MDELEVRLDKLEARVDHAFTVIKQNFVNADKRALMIADAVDELRQKIAVIEMNIDGTIPQDE